ncbi:MAG: YciI family protein [Candidatus Hydrogenedentes bacterium]|nr:YciI family protein [Candidatus Hydrogenedentota bacterium]
MKFLCLICAEKVMEDMPEADAEAHFQEYLEFTERIKANGNFAGGNRLKPSSTAVTVRMRDGKALTSDGPFAETKEQVGGYYLIEATGQEEAVQIASQIPGARYGCVEVRPIADDPQTLTLGLDVPHSLGK